MYKSPEGDAEPALGARLVDQPDTRVGLSKDALLLDALLLEGIRSTELGFIEAVVTLATVV